MRKEVIAWSLILGLFVASLSPVLFLAALFSAMCDSTGHCGDMAVTWTLLISSFAALVIGLLAFTSALIAVIRDKR
jgi:hypothetical protein